MTRLGISIALLLALSVIVPAHGAALHDPFADPNWPNVVLDDEPRWPEIKPENLPDPAVNPKPHFVDPQEVANRILGDHFGPPPTTAGPETTASLPRKSRWLPEPEASRFAFEVGTRYWYSTGSMRFSFTNGNPFFGSPTSVLIWHDLENHSGEIFGRIDHKPTGFFVKGALTGGFTRSGTIVDLDFFFDQILFSDTTSPVKEGWLMSAMIDFGWAYQPTSDIRVGFFAGYHFWRESATAFGFRCNPVSPLIIDPCPAGAVPVGFDTASLIYEPIWHAVRLGFEGKMTFAERWSVSGEVAAVPYAALKNKDSHLLRQDFSDLGPAPNVITKSKYAFGVEAEVFVNYAVTPNIEVGAGARYWGLLSMDGRVDFGPAFNQGLRLDDFSQQRFGVLLNVKGKF